MRALTIVLVAISIFAITGCIPSIHPIYDADTQVYDPALLGTWTSAENDQTWVFSAGLREKNTYLLTQTDGEGNSGEFTVHMAEIGGALFIDLFPEEGRVAGNALYWLHYHPIHTFMRVELEENNLRMYILDSEWLGAHLISNPGSVAHAYTNQYPQYPKEDDKTPILTAETTQLQTWLASIIETSEAWADPIELSREAEKTDWKVRIEGDKLYIDEDSWLSKSLTDTGWPIPVFHRFDGVYPSDWPEGFLLPDGYFLRKEKLELLDAANGESQAAGFRILRLNGMSPLGFEEIVDWFRDQGLAAGFDLTSDHINSTVGETVVVISLKGPGQHYLGFQSEQSRYYRTHLEIWLHQDLGSYTYVSGSIWVDINK